MSMKKILIEYIDKLKNNNTYDYDIKKCILYKDFIKIELIRKLILKYSFLRI